MVTRVRIEATGTDENDVKSMLLAAWAALKEHTSGEWEIESEAVQDTTNGKWGYLVVRRVNHVHE